MFRSVAKFYLCLSKDPLHCIATIHLMSIDYVVVNQLRRKHESSPIGKWIDLIEIEERSVVFFEPSTPTQDADDSDFPSNNILMIIFLLTSLCCSFQQDFFSRKTLPVLTIDFVDGAVNKLREKFSHQNTVSLTSSLASIGVGCKQCIARPYAWLSFSIYLE